MKIRESGMPEQILWESFFDVPEILERLGLTMDIGDVADFGCGYGTFTFEAARRSRGQVHAFDLEPVMLESTRRQGQRLGLDNIDYQLRNFIEDGSGLPDASIDYAMAFNILHGEAAPQHDLLKEIRRILAPGGKLGVIHWNYDPDTPRGPPMEIRAQPAVLRDEIRQVGFDVSAIIDLPPYHFGLVATPGPQA